MLKASLVTRSLRRERYEILDKIGTGGMGVVYRAQDNVLNRTVAIKMLHPNLISDEPSLTRLKQEVVMASKVSHRNVVRVHDFAEADGGAMIVMDWVDGETVAALLNRVHRLRPSLVCDLGAQICEGLEAVHAAGVVHRDIKPGNLIVRRDGGDILISDFGLAHCSGDSTTLSSAGEFRGTTRYAAPEHAAGMPADSRSDIFSVGMVLLEMLTGTIDLAALDGLREELMRGQTERYVRSGELRKLMVLRLAIERCIQLDRKERYASVQEVSADLRRADRAAKAIEPEPSEQPKPKRLWTLHPRSAIGLAAFAILLVPVLFLGIKGHFAGQLRPAPAAQSSTANALYTNALSLITPQSDERDLRRAVALLGEVLAVAPHHAPAANAQLRTLVRLYETTSDLQWLTAARKALTRGEAAGLSKEELALFKARIDLNAGLYQEVIGSIGSLLTSRDDVTRLDATRLLGRALEATGRLQEAASYYRSAAALSPDSWLCHNDLGSIALRLGHLGEARTEFGRVIELNPTSPSGYSNLAAVLLYGGDFREARRYFETALERQASAETYYNLGAVSYYSHEYATAVPFFQSAIDMRPSSQRYVLGLADTLRHSGQGGRARTQYLRALTLLDDYEKKRPLTTEELCQRARCFAGLGDRSAARSALQAAMGKSGGQQTVLYTSAVLAAMEGLSSTARGQAEKAIGAGYPQALVRMDPDLR
ncbi:putative Mitogen-activated protein kinase kinase kinase [Candidatus Sulfopaludibacter sp. SbA4]|nr:putative Mitogen-activated protein kinase kinase kinase [Candidatus Sulfopaludibacter sp. SbA4]